MEQGAPRTPPNVVSSLEFSIDHGIDYRAYPVLLVDDEAENLQAFRLNFDSDFQIFTAGGGAEALEALREREFAVIISDQRMPGMTGTELLQKTTRSHPHLIRIVLTGYTDHESLIQSINAARIYQYITKPWGPEDLKLTLKRAIERYAVEAHNRRLVEDLRESKEEIEAKLRTSMAELKRANERLRKLATSDGLTGLYNHRYFQERWRREVQRAERYSEELSLMVIDVDYFKTYNDTLGHPQGDKLLKEISKLLEASVREVDLVARYGGDEFVIVLPKASKRAATTLGERIRSRVAAAEFPSREVLPLGHLSTSVGIATFPHDGKGPGEVIQAADQALYVAKKAGRNRVATYRAEDPAFQVPVAPRARHGNTDNSMARELVPQLAAEAADREAAAAKAAKAAQDAADAARRAAAAARRAADAALDAVGDGSAPQSPEPESEDRQELADGPLDVPEPASLMAREPEALTDEADDSGDMALDILTDEHQAFTLPAIEDRDIPSLDSELGLDQTTGSLLFGTDAFSDDLDAAGSQDARAAREAVVQAETQPLTRALVASRPVRISAPLDRSEDSSDSIEFSIDISADASADVTADEFTVPRFPGSALTDEPEAEASSRSEEGEASPEPVPAKAPAAAPAPPDPGAARPDARTLTSVPAQSRRSRSRRSRRSTLPSVPTQDQRPPPIPASVDSTAGAVSTTSGENLLDRVRRNRVVAPPADIDEELMPDGSPRRHNVAGAPSEFAPIEVVAGGDPEAEHGSTASLPPLPPSLQQRVHDVAGATGTFSALVVARGDHDDEDESVDQSLGGDPAAEDEVVVEVEED